MMDQRNSLTIISRKDILSSPILRLKVAKFRQNRIELKNGITIMRALFIRLDSRRP